MLDERDLARMDADQLRRYVGVLHEALGHVLGAANEARTYIERGGGAAQRSPARNPMEQLAAESWHSSFPFIDRPI